MHGLGFRRFCEIFGCLWLLNALPRHSSAATIHVRGNGTDAAPGLTWSESLQTVKRALALANPGDEVWVAAGTYTNALVMKAGVALYGGFDGTEAARSERDPLRHETILDGGGTNIVVLVNSGGPETVVDGFTIQNGAGCGVRLLNTGAEISHNRIRGNVSTPGFAYGAGISVKNEGSTATAIIRDNVIIDNYAYDGGGVACIDASPRISANTIAWNTAVQNGGGISCWRDSSPLIENNSIYGNTANWVLDDDTVPVGGGGIFATADDLDGRPHPTAQSSPLIRNNVVAANGAANGGGVALVDANGGAPSVLNNTIVANSGSGIFWGSSALVPIAPKLINNLVAFNPWGLEQLAGTPTNALIQNNCVFGNRVHLYGSNYRGLPEATGTNGNISVDPLLVSPQFGNLHLQPGSPCRDAGRDLSGMVGMTDIDGEPRIEGAAVDIGADESAGKLWDPSPKVVRVTATGDDSAKGATWSDAKKTVAAALDSLRATGGEVWVASGTYREHCWLPAFVHVYGGFAGTETNREERAPGLHETVLNGGGKPNVVLSGHGGFGVSTLDGFTVTGGGNYTGGTSLNKYGLGGKGGGLLVSVSSPIIRNNNITHNSLATDNTTNQFSSYGAGIYCDLSYATIAENTITENEILNTFDGSGGGIYCLYSTPLISSNRIARNQAAYGPAIYSWASAPLILGNTIQSNAMYVLMPLYFGATEGAVSIHLADDALIEGNQLVGNSAGTGAGLYFSAFRAGTVQNNLFIGNHAYDPSAFGGMGGGLYVMVTTNANSAVRIVNNTIVSNVASNLFQELGGGIAFTLFPPATNLVFANNLIVSNSSGLFQTTTTPMPAPVLSHNNVFNSRTNYAGLQPGLSDVHRAVSFQNAPGGDYRLAEGAADIDAGDPLFSPPKDIDAIARPLDGNGDHVAAPDLGAFEFVHPTADTDGDGLPDRWEISTHLNPLENDAVLDPDNDGASNGNEYLAGTDPLDAQSVLVLHALLLGSGEVQCSWWGVVGHTYQITYAATLSPAAVWTAYEPTVPGTGAELSFKTSAPDSARFFRIQVLAPASR